jgi:phage-related protein
VLWKAFGVGSTLSPTVRSVSAALGTVQAAATRFPSETAAVGLLADDMQRAQTLAAAIASADSVQEASKLTSKQATAQLNAAIARLTANLGHLASVARVALPANVAQSFSALVPSGSKKKPAPAPQ